VPAAEKPSRSRARKFFRRLPAVQDYFQVTKTSVEAAPAASRLPELLREVLRSDAELDAFCQSHFPHAHARFTGPMGRAERTRILLDAVPDQQELVARLRDFAPNAPAWGPPRRTWVYLLLLLTLLIALVGGFLAWRMTMGRRVAALLPVSTPWYGARHKEAQCRRTARALAHSPLPSRCSPCLPG